MIYECENAKIFACGALEYCKNFKKAEKIIDFGAEKNWVIFEFIINPPLLSTKIF